MSSTTQRGQFGERIACRYLEERGFVVLAQNYMPARGVKRGEIDLVMQKENVVHFVEVKTRFVSGGELIDVPEAQITRAKLRAMQVTSERFLEDYNLREVVCQFDAISVVFDPETRHAQVKYLADIFL